MARPSLDEIFGRTATADRRPSLAEIFGDTGTPRPSLEEIFSDREKRNSTATVPSRDPAMWRQAAEQDAQPATPLADIWRKGQEQARAYAASDEGRVLSNATLGGTADVLNRNASVIGMNTAEIEHTRDQTAIEEIWNNPSLTTTEKAALYRAAQENPALLEGLLAQRGRWAESLKRGAEAVDPGEYYVPEGGLGRGMHDVARSLPYTVASLFQNAPLSIVGGPLGAVAGGVLSASQEAQMERVDIYDELMKRGMTHEQAYEASNPANWQNMAALSASNIAQNLLTFAGNRILPGAGAAARIMGAIGGDAVLEGGEEISQGVIRNRRLGDPNDWRALGYEGLIGGISGGLFGAGGTLVNAATQGNADVRTQSTPVHGDEQARVQAEQIVSQMEQQEAQAMDFSVMQAAQAQDDMTAAAVEEAAETAAREEAFRRAPLDPESTAIGDTYEPDITIPTGVQQEAGRPSLESIFGAYDDMTASPPDFERSPTQAVQALSGPNAPDGNRPPLESFFGDTENQRVNVTADMNNALPQSGEVNALIDPNAQGAGKSIEVHPGRYDSIRDLAEAAMTNEGRKISGKMFVDYAAVSDAEAQRILADTGLDVSGYTRALTGSSIAHIMDRHGEAGSSLADHRNQKPVTVADLEMLPQLLANPDVIESDVNDRGLDLIISKKRLGDQYIVLEEAFSGRKKLVPLTMWKEDANYKRPNTPPSTSETFQPQGLAGDASAALENSIAPEGGGVNGDPDVQALPSDARSSRFFEPDMPAKAPGETASDYPVKIGDIRRAVEKLVPWRTGRTGPDALGIFKVRSEVTRTQNRNDVTAAMHEVGHYLDKRLGLRGTPNTGAQQELAAAGATTSTPTYTAEQVRAEGVAQFFLEYTVDREQAATKYPEYFREFDTALNARPEIKRDVGRIVDLVSSYLRQDTGERLRASTVRGTDKIQEPVRDKLNRLGQQLYDNWVDSLAPLRRVGEQVREKMGLKHLSDELNIYAQARTAPGYRGKAAQDVSAYFDVIKDLGPDDHTPLSNYLIASRAQDYRANGMEPGVGTNAVEEAQLIRDTPQHIKDAAKELRRVYNETVQKTLVDTGMMSQQQFDMLQERWPNYVPFLRVDSASQLDHDLNVFMKGRGKSLVNLANPMKKTTGVGDASAVMEVRDPLETMLRNMDIFHSIAARNNVGKTMVNISQIEGMGRFAERVGGPGERGESVFYVWNDGKKEYYATDPDVYAALTSVNESLPTSDWEKPLIKLADAFKMGTTRYNPAFALFRNLPRDSWESAINSESWTPPMVNAIKGLAMQYSKDPKMQAIVQEAIDQGVLYSGITEMRSTSPEGIAKSLTRAFKEGGVGADVKRNLHAMAEWVGSHNEAIEVAPKLQEYLYLRQQGVPKKEAAMRAREVNIDFARAGRTGRKLNRITAFFNVQVQGIDKVARSAAARPKQTMFKAALFAGIPSLLAWGLGNLDDEETRKEYNELSKQQKDMYWNFKIGDSWYKLPKPNTYGLVGSLLERTLDKAYKDDPAAFRGFWGTLWDEGVPPMMPNLIMAGIESATDYNFFTERPIVPRKMEGLPPEMQYTENTSEVSKALSRYLQKVTGNTVSPMRIDHVLRNVGGTVGMEFVNAPNLIFEDRRPDTATGVAKELPFVRSLVQAPFADPYRNSESIDRFYEVAEQTRDERTRYETQRQAGERVTPGRDVQYAKLFADQSRILSQLRRQRAAMQEHPRMSQEQKEERTRAIDRRMIDLARQTLERYDNAGRK